MARQPTVLFIAGLGRSGSTLVDRVLGSLPGVQSLGEVVHLWQRGLVDNETCGCHEPFRSCPFWGKVGQAAYGGWDDFDVAEAMRLQRAVDRTRYVPLLAAPGIVPGFRRSVERYASQLGDLYHAAAEVAGADPAEPQVQLRARGLFGCDERRSCRRCGAGPAAPFGKVV